MTVYTGFVFVGVGIFVSVKVLYVVSMYVCIWGTGVWLVTPGGVGMKYVSW